MKESYFNYYYIIDANKMDTIYLSKTKKEEWDCINCNLVSEVWICCISLIKSFSQELSFLNVSPFKRNQETVDRNEKLVDKNQRIRKKKNFWQTTL